MNEYLLKTYGLTKQYGHMKAVDHVNLHLKKGAIYGFIGRNRAKNNLLKNDQWSGISDIRRD